MKLEDQVCSLELSKRLKKLGVKQESLWDWADYDGDWKLYPRDYHPEDITHYSAFTVAELGEILPLGIDHFKKEDGWCVEEPMENLTVNADTFANAMAKMVIYLKEKR